MKNFFKGISFSSIFAGALAAVTSFLLSAKIGIAGSVIGVAAGSIVSAVATQVYKNVLKASGEKLQNAVPFVANDKDGTDGAGKSGDDATTVIAPAESEGEQTKTLSAEESDETTVMTSVDGDTTTAMPATSGRVISSAQAGGRESNMLPDNAGGSIQHAGRRASFDAWLHGKRAPIVIAIVSALIGVAVSAGLILAFTGGHGTDTVVRDMVNCKQTPSAGYVASSPPERMPARRLVSAPSSMTAMSMIISSSWLASFAWPGSTGSSSAWMKWSTSTN